MLVSFGVLSFAKKFQFVLLELYKYNRSPSTKAFINAYFTYQQLINKKRTKKVYSWLDLRERLTT